MGDELRCRLIESYIVAYNRFDVAGMLSNANPEIIAPVTIELPSA